MIWAFEYLTEEDHRHLRYLEPLMGIRFDKSSMMVIYKTYCAGYENGVELRRIRMFNLEETRQGFICDDWHEAMSLSYGMQDGDFAVYGLLKKYPWLDDYFAPRKDNIWMNCIAMPVHTFIETHEGHPYFLDDINLNDLLK